MFLLQRNLTSEYFLQTWLYLTLFCTMLLEMLWICYKHNLPSKQHLKLQYLKNIHFALILNSLSEVEIFWAPFGERKAL